MNSITAAKNRRANGGTPPPPSPTQSQLNIKNGQQSGQPAQKGLQNALTLPQVIQIVDLRLTNLEKSMTELKISSPPAATNEKNVHFDINTGSNVNTPTTNVEINKLLENVVKSDLLKETIDEFDKRYDLLAEEIILLKNIVLNLQSYTMDVNKLLMEERSRFIHAFGLKPNLTNDTDIIDCDNTPDDESSPITESTIKKTL